MMAVINPLCGVILCALIGVLVVVLLPDFIDGQFDVGQSSSLADSPVPLPGLPGPVEQLTGLSTSKGKTRPITQLTEEANDSTAFGAITGEMCIIIRLSRTPFVWMRWPFVRKYLPVVMVKINRLVKNIKTDTSYMDGYMKIMNDAENELCRDPDIPDLYDSDLTFKTEHERVPEKKNRQQNKYDGPKL